MIIAFPAPTAPPITINGTQAFPYSMAASLDDSILSSAKGIEAKLTIASKAAHNHSNVYQTVPFQRERLQFLSIYGIDSASSDSNKALYQAIEKKSGSSKCVLISSGRFSKNGLRLFFKSSIHCPAFCTKAFEIASFVMSLFASISAS